MFRVFVAMLFLPVATMASVLEFRQGSTVLHGKAQGSLPAIEEVAEEILPQLDRQGRIVLQPVKTGTRVRLEPQAAPNAFKVTVWQTSVVARGWKRTLCVPVLFSAETSTVVTCQPGTSTTVLLPQFGAQLVFRR